MKPDIYALLELALLSDDPDEKGRLTDEAFAAVQNGVCRRSEHGWG